MEKYFTLEEANRALSLVSPIVRDILSKMKTAQELHDAVKLEREYATVKESDLLERLAYIEKLLNEIEYHMQELESVGATLKDLKLGLVDFPCLYKGRLVYLCWRLEEKGINYWHELDHGFLDRKPVDESFKSTAMA